MKYNIRDYLKKTWNFLWNDDSLLSWIVNIVLAFVLIKFIVYPGLGLLLSTSHPVVAVVSESMEHKTVPVCVEKTNKDIGRTFLNCKDYNYAICGKSYDEKQKVDFDFFWKDCGEWYGNEDIAITPNNFKNYRFKNGFNKGDIMVLRGKNVGDIEIGETIVFQSGKPDPIIHRVVKKWKKDGEVFFQTKGDHNEGSLTGFPVDETSIKEEQVIGTALFRIHLLGYIKIGFVEVICFDPIQSLLKPIFKNLSCNG